MDPKTDTSAPSNAGVTSDSVGGTFSNQGAGPDSTTSAGGDPSAGTFSNTDSAPQGDISAGYDNNIERQDGGEKKGGFLSKVKDKFVPKPGGTGGGDDLTADGAASFRPDASSGDRHAQANADLNRE